MRTGLIAKALGRRFDFTRLTAAAFARIARSPSYQAPSAANLHEPGAFPPPDERSPLDAFGARDIVIENGSVVGMSLAGRSFISNGAALLRKVPLGAVRLVAVQPFVAELARCPHLASMRRLDLPGCRIGVEGTKELAGSPYLGGLRELNLSENDLGLAGIAALAEAPWLANLERLELADNGIQCNAVKMLLSAAGGLTHLDLSRNPLASGDGFPSSGRHGGRSLQSLAVSGCGLGPEGVREFLRGDCSALRQLELSFNGLGADKLPALPPALVTLDLSFNDLGDEGIARLASKPPRPALASLDLSANRITLAGVKRLADSGWLSLPQLNLDINPIEDKANRYNLPVGTAA
jgi:hypothetical protein